MAQSINGSLGARGALHSLAQTQEQLGETRQRVSTGRRINRAEDDTAGLQITNKFIKELRALSQAMDNADLGMGRLDVVEGAVGKASELLMQAGELAARAASDSLSAEDRAALNDAYRGIRQELDALHSGTDFGGKAVFGDDAAFEVAVGADGETLAIEGASISADALGLTDTSLLTGEAAAAAGEAVQGGLSALSKTQANVGAYGTSLRNQGSDLGARLLAVAGANSRIQDADQAREAASLTRLQILSDAGLAALAQSNQQAKSVLSLF